MVKPLPVLPPVRWFASTPVRIGLCAAGAALGVFAVSLAVERSLTIAAPTTEALLAHGAAGLLTGLLLWLLLTEWKRRRDAIREYLALVADLNHHIRNALSAIQLTYFIAKDKENFNAVQHAIDRIDWALRELLGHHEPPPATRHPQAQDSETESASGKSST